MLKRINDFLLNKRFLAAIAVRALGKAARGTGRRNGFVDHFEMLKRIHCFRLGFAAVLTLTGKGLYAFSGAGGVGGHNAFVPVMALCRNLGEALGIIAAAAVRAAGSARLSTCRIFLRFIYKRMAQRCNFFGLGCSAFKGTCEGLYACSGAAGRSRNHAVIPLMTDNCDFFGLGFAAVLSLAGIGHYAGLLTGRRSRLFPTVPVMRKRSLLVIDIAVTAVGILAGIGGIALFLAGRRGHNGSIVVLGRRNIFRIAVAAVGILAGIGHFALLRTGGRSGDFACIVVVDDVYICINIAVVAVCAGMRRIALCSTGGRGYNCRILMTARRNNRVRFAFRADSTGMRGIACVGTGRRSYNRFILVARGLNRIRHIAVQAVFTGIGRKSVRRTGGIGYNADVFVIKRRHFFLCNENFSAQLAMLALRLSGYAALRRNRFVNDKFMFKRRNLYSRFKNLSALRTILSFLVSGYAALRRNISIRYYGMSELFFDVPFYSITANSAGIYGVALFGTGRRSNYSIIGMRQCINDLRISIRVTIAIIGLVAVLFPSSAGIGLKTCLCASGIGRNFFFILVSERRNLFATGELFKAQSACGSFGYTGSLASSYYACRIHLILFRMVERLNEHFFANRTDLLSGAGRCRSGRMAFGFLQCYFADRTNLIICTGRCRSGRMAIRRDFVSRIAVLTVFTSIGSKALIRTGGLGNGCIILVSKRRDFICLIEIAAIRAGVSCIALILTSRHSNLGLIRVAKAGYILSLCSTAFSTGVRLYTRLGAVRLLRNHAIVILMFKRRDFICLIRITAVSTSIGGIAASGTGRFGYNCLIVMPKRINYFLLNHGLFAALTPLAFRKTGFSAGSVLAGNNFFIMAQRVCDCRSFHDFIASGAPLALSRATIYTVSRYCRNDLITVVPKLCCKFFFANLTVLRGSTGCFCAGRMALCLFKHLFAFRTNLRNRAVRRIAGGMAGGVYVVIHIAVAASASVVGITLVFTGGRSYSSAVAVTGSWDFFSIGITAVTAGKGLLACFGACGGLGHFAGVAVAQSINNFLSNEYFFTYGALLSFGKTCIFTGCFYCRNDFFRVAGSRNNFGVNLLMCFCVLAIIAILILASKGLFAIGSASGFDGYNAVIIAMSKRSIELFAAFRTGLRSGAGCRRASGVAGSRNNFGINLLMCFCVLAIIAILVLASKGLFTIGSASGFDGYNAVIIAMSKRSIELFAANRTGLRSGAGCCHAGGMRRTRPSIIGIRECIWVCGCISCHCIRSIAIFQLDISQINSFIGNISARLNCFFKLRLIVI